MRYINVFYISILLVGIALWQLNRSMGKEVVTFYGFAENKETEINYNYSVVVGKIHVSPGQRVKQGTPLLDMYRINAKETLADQPFRIEELRAKVRAWQQEKRGRIKLKEQERTAKIAALDAEIEKLTEAQKFKASLYKDLQNVTPAEKTYSPTEIKIAALEKEKATIRRKISLEITNLRSEISLGENPYQAEIRRLEAEKKFDQANKKIPLQMEAPTDGVIGNIYCKEAEHIPSYKTLVSFYEPNPSLVKGFVQEDLILHVALQDSFLVRSTKDPVATCYGIVTGLGSRIIEIPERLRKIPTMKTYGREVLVSIPKTNNFLQKEKVILEFLNPPQGIRQQNYRKPMVDLKVSQ